MPKGQPLRQEGGKPAGGACERQRGAAEAGEGGERRRRGRRRGGAQAAAPRPAPPCPCPDRRPHGSGFRRGPARRRGSKPAAVPAAGGAAEGERPFVAGRAARGVRLGRPRGDVAAGSPRAAASGRPRPPAEGLSRKVPPWADTRLGGRRRKRVGGEGAAGQRGRPRPATSTRPGAVRGGAPGQPPARCGAGPRPGPRLSWCSWCSRPCTRAVRVGPGAGDGRADFKWVL